VIPKFNAADFVSFYIEVPVMLAMFIFWMLLKRPGLHRDGSGAPQVWYSDLVDVKNVDLSRDEYSEGEHDRTDDEQRINRVKGNKWYLWRLYYWIA
jgi:amino acid transporter, AAT family